jgi:hypothetical protein
MESVLQKMVTESGVLLRHIPYDMQTQEICDIATKENPYSLEYVRLDFQNSEMCKTAVIKKPDSFDFVRPDLQTEEMAIIALIHYPFMSKFIRLDLIDRVRFVIKMIKSNVYKSSSYNNIVEMIKYEIKYMLTTGKIENGLVVTPMYMINYMIDYYMPDINEAAASFTRDYPYVEPSIDLIQDYCSICASTMTLFINEKSFCLYDCIKNI